MKRALVDQPLDALAHGQLALLLGLLVVALRPAGPRALEGFRQVAQTCGFITGASPE